MLRRGPELALGRQHGLVDAGPWRRHCDWHHHLQPRLLRPRRHLRALPRGVVHLHLWCNGLLAVPRWNLWRCCRSALASCCLLRYLLCGQLPWRWLHQLHVLSVHCRFLLPQLFGQCNAGALPSGLFLRCGPGRGYHKPVPRGLLLCWRLIVHGAGKLRCVHGGLLLQRGKYDGNVEPLPCG